MKRLALSFALLLSLVALPAAAQEMQLPEPRGYVNDFANVIPDAEEPALAARIQQVRDSTGGVIVLVTLPSLGGRSRDEVALQIGREWKVGEAGAASTDARAELGSVVLVVPSERTLKIELARGTNQFITAAEAGRIRDAMTPALRENNVGEGMRVAVAGLAEHYEAHAADAPVRATSEEGGVSGTAILVGILTFLGLGGLLMMLRRAHKRRGAAWRAQMEREAEVASRLRRDAERSRSYDIQTPDSARSSYRPSPAPRSIPVAPAPRSPSRSSSTSRRSSGSSSGSSYSSRSDDDNNRNSGYGSGFGGGFGGGGGGSTPDFGGGGGFDGGGAGGDY